MVALGVVSKIEREILQAEYESWIYAEAVQCRQVHRLNERDERFETENFEKWYNEYCGSCLGEAGRLGFK